MATIRARYEKGAFIPLEPLELEEGLEVDVLVSANGDEEGASSDKVDEPARPADPFDTEEPPPGINPTMWRIANLHKKYPPGTFDHWPTDLSVNYKHYLYGHPKVTEDE